jgi:hypothetical protein
MISNTTKQIISASLSKSPSKVQEVFASAVNRKILGKIEAMKAEVGANLIGTKK